MDKKKKIHQILEYITSENDRTGKSCFNSGEIASALTPKLDIHVVNSLCRLLKEYGDVRDCTTKDESSRKMVAIMVITDTHDAYHTGKYLDVNEEPRISTGSSIISGDNIIIGNISGDVKQDDHITLSNNEKEDKKWLKYIYWVVGIIVGIIAIFTFIKSCI